MEILVNQLIEYVSSKNTIIDIEQIEILSGNSIKNKAILRAKNISNKKVNLLNSEFYYQTVSNETEIVFYFKCEYKYYAEIIDNNEVKESIDFDFIRYGFMPFEITNEFELYSLPYNYQNPIKKEEYKHPPQLKEFQKLKIRKRKLICHYTEREIAIEKILFTRSLRFNELKNTNDPWEYKKNINPSIRNGNDLFRAIGKSNETQFQSEKVKSLSFTKDLSKIRCFENQLMWSHYAENHKGICLVFDERKLKKLFEQQFLKKRELIEM